MQTMSFAFMLFVALAFVTGGARAQTDAANSKQQVSIQGRNFYKDGVLWLPKGVHAGAFARPLIIPSAPKWMNDSAAQTRSMWGAEELNAAKRVFGADTVRLDVSQSALDPQSTIYDPAYQRDILGAVKLARSLGLVVIVVVNAQAPSAGDSNLACMPSENTIRAWKTLVPLLMADQGIMFELFNEPCKFSNAQNKAEWASSMQALINTVRGIGSKNILLLDGLWWARSTNGLFPLVRDTLPNRMALAIHPYIVKDSFVNQKQWQDNFGGDATRYPTLATEWNVTLQGGCADNISPPYAHAIMQYLGSLHIGVIGWGIDSTHGQLVKDHVNFVPTDFSDCNVTTGSGGQLFAHYPNN